MTSFLNYNGIGMSLLNYYNYIDADKIQMDYLVPNKVDEELKKAFTKKGNKLFEFDYKNKKMHQRRPIKYCIKLYKLIKQEKYDIVHAHGSSSMLFLQLLTAKAAGVKVRIAHSRNTESDFKVLDKLCKPLFQLSYNEAFSCGKEAGEFLFGKNKEFTIIPNGKDSKIFSYKEDVRKQYREKYHLQNKIVLGHIGNFNYQKNHAFLIDIMYKLCKENDNYCLMLAGDGSLRKDIENKVHELHLESNIIFLGQISNSEVANLLNAMDIMIFPSRYEGFPNVLIEWQMNGLPCLISDTITKDVQITNLVHFLSIENPDLWINEIRKIELLDRKDENATINKLIKDAGYDIETNAKMLEEKYISLYEKNYKKI